MSKLHTLTKLVGLGAAFIAFGAQAGPRQKNIFDRNLDLEVRRITSFKGLVAPDYGASKACKTRFKKIFNKKEINISVAFGYGDSDDNSVAWDALIYPAMVEKLTKSCAPGVGACGFSQDRKNPTILRKIVMDPTGENNSLITLNMTHPSLSVDGKMNTSINAEKQQIACQTARSKFMGEISGGADIAFYIGHSRDGGGPDFCPAKRLSNNHVDYNLYRKQKAGIADIVKAMGLAIKNGTPTQVYGSFSCSSQLHFEKALRQVNPKAGFFLTSRTVDFVAMTLDAYTSLDSILAQRCEDGFQEAFGARAFGTNPINFF